MKKYYLLCCFVIYAPVLYSQNTVNVSVKSDDVENLKIIKARLPLWEPSISGYNFSLYDVNVGVATVFEKFMATADFSFSVLDRVLPDNYEKDISGNTVTQMIMFPVF